MLGESLLNIAVYFLFILHYYVWSCKTHIQHAGIDFLLWIKSEDGAAFTVAGKEEISMSFSHDTQVGGFVYHFTRRCHLPQLMLYFLTWLGTCQVLFISVSKLCILWCYITKFGTYWKKQAVVIWLRNVLSEISTWHGWLLTVQDKGQGLNSCFWTSEDTYSVATPSAPQEGEVLYGLCKQAPEGACGKEGEKQSCSSEGREDRNMWDRTRRNVEKNPPASCVSWRELWSYGMYSYCGPSQASCFWQQTVVQPKE